MKIFRIHKNNINMESIMKKRYFSCVFSIESAIVWSNILFKSNSKKISNKNIKRLYLLEIQYPDNAIVEYKSDSFLSGNWKGDKRRSIDNFYNTQYYKDLSIVVKDKLYKIKEYRDFHKLEKSYMTEELRINQSYIENIKAIKLEKNSLNVYKKIAELYCDIEYINELLYEKGYNSITINENLIMSIFKTIFKSNNKIKRKRAIKKLNDIYNLYKELINNDI